MKINTINAIIFLLPFIFFACNILADENKELNENIDTKTKELPSGIAYEVTFDFLPQPLLVDEQQLTKKNQSSLEELLLVVSEAHRLENKPPLSLLILNRRAGTDIAALHKALRSRAYYNANISYFINKSAKPVRLVYKLKLGYKYVFDQLSIRLIDKVMARHQSSPPTSTSSTASLILPSAEEIGLKPGEPADARAVLKAQRKLLKALKKQSYAYAKLANKEFIVDHQNKTMQVLFEVDPGPSIRFGKTQFTGMETIADKFLQSLIAWNNKDLYHPNFLKKTTNNIVASDLFSTVRIELPAADKLSPSAVLTIPVIIHLKERLQRSIKAQAGFDTDTGITIGAKWTHRNYFGAGEKLSVETAWTGVGPLLDVRFNKPSFYAANQSFIANLKLQNEETDAYKSSSFTMGAGIERTLQKNMNISLGLAFKHSQITDKSVDLEKGASIDSSQNFSLLYLPLKFTWDYSNDLFEPDRGGKILLQGAPFMDVQSDLMFGKMYASYIQYLKLMSEPKLVLAGRVAIGQILGADAYQLPADERFYSGGGGSVRGYGYQLIGPLDKNNNPQGGNALLEFALESRFNFTKTIGAVIFVDGGSAYSSSFFDGSSDLLYGAGLGVRYSSPMGPLRADVAIPVNRREGVDDAFQIYLSIGQAF
ncbi:MAG: BamA/TamA family outer membrane protein [Pseudomonadota bacterium]